MAALFPSDSQKRAYDTFLRANLPDRRLGRRLIKYAAAQAADPTASTSACAGGDLAEREGAFRLLENSRVKAERIEEGPFRSTAANCVGRGRILLIQDTTFVAMASKRLHEEKLDKGHQQGLLARSSLAVDGNNGETIGLLAQRRWMRPPKTSWRKQNNRKRPLAEKESARWLNVDAEARRLLPRESEPISVCATEADFFEFLHSMNRQNHRFVVRAKDRLCKGL